MGLLLDRGTHKAIFPQTIAQVLLKLTHPREEPIRKVVGTITSHCGLNEYVAPEDIPTVLRPKRNITLCVTAQCSRPQDIYDTMDLYY